MALIVLHELGHFAIAKAVGMRVERFSLFFPPRLFGRRIGETDYSVGAIPAGGYVKITGMTWEEIKDTDLRLAQRAYCMQPPWKRIAVILAGPGVNILIAFVLFWLVLLSGDLHGSMALENLDPAVRTAGNRPVREVGAGQAGGRRAAGGRPDPHDRRPAGDGRNDRPYDQSSSLRRQASGGMPCGHAGGADREAGRPDRALERLPRLQRQGTPDADRLPVRQHPAQLQRRRSRQRRASRDVAHDHQARSPASAKR